MGRSIGRIRRKYLEARFNQQRRSLLKELNQGRELLQGDGTWNSAYSIATSFRTASINARNLARLSRALNHPQHIIDDFKELHRTQKSEYKTLNKRKHRATERN